MEILRSPFNTYQLADLLDMTDRQLYEIFIEGVGEEKEPEPQKQSSQTRHHSQSTSMRSESHSRTYKDANGYTWDIPKPRDEAVLKVDGRPIDGEAAIDNFVRMGLVKKEDAARVKAQRRVYLESLKQGENHGENRPDAGATQE